MKNCEEYKRGKDGVYYDIKHDHLVMLYWLGNRFYLEAEFDDCSMKAKSKPYPSTEKAELYYVGDL